MQKKQKWMFFSEHSVFIPDAKYLNPTIKGQPNNAKPNILNMVNWLYSDMTVRSIKQRKN